jgi:putative oxidoreductase
MSVSEYLSPLLGRWLLAWFLLAQVVHYGGDWDGTITLMTFQGIPMAPLVLILALTVLILGSLSLIFGFHTRHGAMMLFGATILSTLLMNDFWKIDNNAATRLADFELFARDIAIAGGFLLLVGMGPGPLALDNRMDGKKKKK